MIRRFACLLPNSPDAVTTFDASARALRGLRRIALHAAMVMYADGDVIPFGDGTGAVLGTLFTKDGRSERVRTLDMSPRPLDAGAVFDKCLADYWGNYLVFVVNDFGELHLLRDPSGAVPCYYTRTSLGLLFASDLVTLEALALTSLDVDWDYIGRHLIAPDFRTSATALHGLHELTAGASLCVSAAGLSTRQIWSPWQYAIPLSNEAFDDQAARLKAVVETCTLALASEFQGILVSLSGGLDSSVVAAALAPVRDKLTLLTMITDEPEGDERRYSTLLAAALDLPMTAVPYTAYRTDLFATSSAHLPRPTLPALVQSEFAAKLQAASDNGLQAIFTGNGGDNVFCNMTSATPILDHFLACGPSPAAWETVREICRMTGASYSKAIWSAVKRGLRRDAAYRWKVESGFVNPDIAARSSNELDHPWLHAPAGALPGSAAHIAKLLRIQGSIDGLPRLHPLQVNPLLSQPIVEACVSIPTWQWCSGGINRAVIRKAFADALPGAITRRTSKGGPDTYAYKLVDGEKRGLRDFLLGGRLAEQSLLDLSALDQALRVDRPINHTDYVHLLILAEAEAWVRYRMPTQKSAAQRALQIGAKP